MKGYLRYKVDWNSNKEEGKEGLENVAIARTIHFDKFINESKDKVEQFVVMGAGYDTRCYEELKKNNLKFFELDQANTQKLKMECLKNVLKAFIASENLTLGDFKFMGHKTKKGTFGVVAEVIILRQCVFKKSGQVAETFHNEPVAFSP